MATVSTQSWIASITLPTASLYINLTLDADQDVLRQSNSTFQSWPNISETLVTTISFSSEGTTLTGEYQELGLALNQMVSDETDDDWRIKTSVYDASRYIAGFLMDNLYPAPRIFNHWPNSVVLNWTQETNNWYLTISTDRISALMSTPERITFRKDWTATELINPASTLFAIIPGSSQQIEGVMAKKVTASSQANW